MLHRFFNCFLLLAFGFIVSNAQEPKWVIVEDSASYMGKDIDDFKKYLESIIEIPITTECLKFQINIQFSIDKSGNVIDIVIKDSTDIRLKKAIKNALETTSGKWKPGQFNKNPIIQEFNFPIHIRNSNPRCESAEYLIDTADYLYSHRRFISAFLYYEEAFKKNKDCKLYYKIIDYYIDTKKDKYHRLI